MARTRYRLASQWLQLGPHCGERVLDVGAGNGAFIAEALRRAPQLQIFGAEFSQAAIDLAHPEIRPRLRRCNLQSTTEAAPWDDDFQVVVCMEVLEHMPDDVLAIKHIARAIAPGGRLLISVPAWESKWGPQDVTAGHVRRYQPNIMHERLGQAGLRVQRIKCWGGPVCWAYLRATDLIGPQKIMTVKPTGIAGAAANGIYHLLKIDDLLSFNRGPQLLVLADKPGPRRP